MRHNPDLGAGKIVEECADRQFEVKFTLKGAIWVLKLEVHVCNVSFCKYVVRLQCEMELGNQNLLSRLYTIFLQSFCILERNIQYNLSPFIVS